MIRRSVFFLLVALSPQIDPIRAQEAVTTADGTNNVHVENHSDNHGNESPEQGDAVKIVALQSAIESDKQRLGELKSEQTNSQQQFELIGKEFNQLNAQLEEKKEALQKLENDGQATESKTLEAEIEELQKKWVLVKEQFDLAVKSRMTTSEQIAALEKKIEEDGKALDRLTGISKPRVDTDATATNPTTTNGNTQSATSPGPQPPATESPIAPAAGITPANQAPDIPTGADQAPQRKPQSEKLVKAREEASEKLAQAEEAKRAVEEHSERRQALQKDIELEQQALQTARKKIDVLDQRLEQLQQEFSDKLAAGEARRELVPIQSKVGETQRELRNTRLDIRRRSERLDSLRVQFAAVQTEELELLRDAERKRLEAEAAAGKVRRYENPFTPENMFTWLINNGPKILGILVGMFVLRRLSRTIGSRATRLLVRNGIGSREERQNRANTLVAAFQSAVSVTIVIAGCLMVLDVVGVPIATLLGGAAVLGLAVAFGAQNLVRDYFSGFMILLENQYKLNDIVTIGTVTGAVERISIRLTVIRDLEGRAHFIPNGQIAQVTNRTHEWARAVFDIPVAYKENVDNVMEVLITLAKEMRNDSAFGPFIVANPEMLGVDVFGDSGVVIKFIMKTSPNKMWPVRREMLRRIKNKFDELGIEIPFPHRTIYHRQENGASQSAAVARQQNW